jgi:hypothetical protein
MDFQNNCEVPSFTREQLEEFNTLTRDFLDRYFRDYIDSIEIEVRYNPPTKPNEAFVPVLLSASRCRDGVPVPGDPCAIFGKVWR